MAHATFERRHAAVQEGGGPACDAPGRLPALCPQERVTGDFLSGDTLSPASRDTLAGCKHHTVENIAAVITRARHPHCQQ
jgi:hypothetical protein